MLFPGGTVVKNPPASTGDAGDVGSIPELGRAPGEEGGNPLQYSCLDNPMERGAWRAIVHGATKSWTRLSAHTHAHTHTHTHTHPTLLFTHQMPVPKLSKGCVSFTAILRKQKFMLLELKNPGK